MTAAFKTALPSTQKFVLLALCDSANDQGECYPSIQTVMEKCSLSERAVQGAITALEVAKQVRREFRKGRSTVYWITPTPAATAPPQQLRPAADAPQSRRFCAPTPAAGAPAPAARAPITITQPSEETKDLAPTVLVETAGAAPTAYKRPACPTESLVALYHEHLPHLPRVEILSESRKRHASARWAAVCGESKYDREQGLEWFAWFFSHVAKSAFLTGRVKGRGGSSFRCTFDFLMTPEKFTRVVENFYHKEAA